MDFTPSTKVIGRQNVHIESLDSTNDHALMLIAKSNPIEGTVISTDFQSAGRGQRNNIWQSTKGKNLLFTVILYPEFLRVSNQFYLSMMVSNAIIKCLGSILLSEKLWIKWPNDIYFEDKKLAGILIQNNLKGDRIASSIIGVGLNVNQTIFDPQLSNPTSLTLLLDRKLDRSEIMTGVLKEMDDHFDDLKNGYFKKLKSVYEGKLYRRGELSKISSGGDIIEGVILGVEEDGRILLNVNGKLKKLRH